ncbi:hypothetical protein VTJ04DRAFT_1315 [Mycothermus thermophilus]|uniref:uncharacterized protein n=1 Tax=Humicola insolens TaxID=85995 RepID=UPI00374372EE
MQRVFNITSKSGMYWTVGAQTSQKENISQTSHDRSASSRSQDKKIMQKYVNIATQKPKYSQKAKPTPQAWMSCHM